MKSYDEIREHLQAELDRAMELHSRENTTETQIELRMAQERYNRFALHGMIPHDISE
jgi:hypothetical protein